MIPLKPFTRIIRRDHHLRSHLSGLPVNWLYPSCLHLDQTNPPRSQLMERRWFHREEPRCDYEWPDNQVCHENGNIWVEIVSSLCHSISSSEVTLWFPLSQIALHEFILAHHVTWRRPLWAEWLGEPSVLKSHLDLFRCLTCIRYFKIFRVLSGPDLTSSRWFENIPGSLSPKVSRTWTSHLSLRKCSDANVEWEITDDDSRRESSARIRSLHFHCSWMSSLTVRRTGRLTRVEKSFKVSTCSKSITSHLLGWFFRVNY
jgi:hypothetical protein